MDFDPVFYVDYQLPSSFELRVCAYRVPLRHRFRGITERSGLLLHGPAGWAEVSPFWDYGVAYSARWLMGGIDAAVNGYPEIRRQNIPVNATIPAVEPEAAYSIARASTAKSAKVKIAEPGHSLNTDCERLAAVRDALGNDAQLRVDINARWSAEYAISAIPHLDTAARGLEYVEQPCASVEALGQVRRAVGVRIAADESIRRAADPFQVVRAQAADLVVLKNQPLGGVRAALALAEQLGLPVVVSSALESSVGLYAGVRLAAALPELPFACGLATAQLLADDVSADPLLPTNGEIAVRTAPLPVDGRGGNDSKAGILTANSGGAHAQLIARWAQRLADMWSYLQYRGQLSEAAHYTWVC